MPRGSLERLAKQRATTAKYLMTIMNQLSQQIQHPTKLKRRQSNKRDGRSFWQPDGTKEVRKLSSEEWLGLWQTPPPTETTATWRYAMNSQKQAILQRHRRPLNGHRYPGRKKTPPRQLGGPATLLTDNTAPPVTFTVEKFRNCNSEIGLTNQRVKSSLKMSSGRPRAI